MGEQIWLCEHPPVYTMGTSAEPSNLIDPPFDVIETGRGGQVTYHGPGQRVVYAMLNLNRRAKKDLHAYIHWLQSWGQRALAEIGIKTIMRDDRIGLWVPPAKYGLAQESKIMAVGVRVKKWVTYHGMAINVNPDLSHFDGIIPCGIRDYGVTSVGACGIRADMDDLDQALRDTYLEFGMD
jgi:lipoyl(octanoyl) transferase